MDQPISYWLDSTTPTNYAKLKEEINTECLIIGGGIAGISTALALQEAGMSTVILERDRIGHGTTGYTTAKITSGHNLVYSDLIKSFGIEQARQYAEANTYGIKKIKENIETYNIDCYYKDLAHIIYTREEKRLEKFEKELEACHALHLPVSFQNNLPLPFSTWGGLRYEEQGQFHPLLYLQQLAAAYIEKGGKIYENTKAEQIDYKNNVISTEEGLVKAGNIVITTHYPYFDQGHLYFMKMYPYTSYIIAIKRTKDMKPINDMYINTDFIIRSFRSLTTQKGDYLLIGGGSHRTGQSKHEQNHFITLINYAKEIYGSIDLAYTWAAGDYVASDKVPYIGHLAEDINNIYVATGFGKWGMTHGTASGKIISDLILKGENPWQDIYSPSRHMHYKGFIHTLENGLDSGLAYVKSMFDAGKVSEINNLKSEEACVIKLHHQRIGIYKDTKGQLFALDTSCPHLGCHVEWNQATRTWDCPCHGSRYRYDGTLIDGPSNKNLRHISFDEFQGTTFPRIKDDK